MTLSTNIYAQVYTLINLRGLIFPEENLLILSMCTLMECILLKIYAREYTTSDLLSRRTRYQIGGVYY